MGTKGEKMTGASGLAAESLHRRLSNMGDVRLRKMFGGYGVFEADTMFALVDRGGDIYLKVDDSNRGLFETAGSQKHARMPYYRVPDEVLSDETALQEWARTSILISKKAS